MPKVSIVIPVYNVEKYLRECLDSAVNQTLRDIEIICVNDGSTDGSLAILEEYAKNDERVKVINKPNAGYGHTMNVGLDAATGEYLGIIESDDYVSLEMYARLHEVVSANKLDIIKADFSQFSGNGAERRFIIRPITRDKKDYYRIINPQKEIRILMEAFYTWAGLYRLDFLRKNNIRHNETPGASYQDNGFFFQTFSCAEKLMLLPENMYKLRRDNPDSSFHSKQKVYCICEEYDFIYRFLKQDTTRFTRFLAPYCASRFQAYMFTYNRVSEEFKLPFLMRFSEDFRKTRDQGELNMSLMSERQRDQLTIILDSPERFYKAQPSQKPAPGKNMTFFGKVAKLRREKRLMSAIKLRLKGKKASK